MEKFAEIMIDTIQKQILDSIKKESLVTIPYSSRVPISGNLLGQAAKLIDEQKIIKIITEGIEEQIAKTVINNLTTETINDTKRLLSDNVTREKLKYAVYPKILQVLDEMSKE